MNKPFEFKTSWKIISQIPDKLDVLVVQSYMENFAYQSKIPILELLEKINLDDAIDVNESHQKTIKDTINFGYNITELSTKLRIPGWSVHFIFDNFSKKNIL